MWGKKKTKFEKEKVGQKFCKSIQRFQKSYRLQGKERGVKRGGKRHTGDPSPAERKERVANTKSLHEDSMLRLMQTEGNEKLRRERTAIKSPEERERSIKEVRRKGVQLAELGDTGGE